MVEIDDDLFILAFVGVLGIAGAFWWWENGREGGSAFEMLTVICIGKVNI